ncbi:MAG: hypothetical protein COX46_01115 [bacterium (Candidatus Ratteibacteria) CG23_combo_of_CG06-09_8_20_14_all_48_7]|uniref:Type II toxin-antitoxin system mRNA interferase toxin, RelE/StbE family n=1 Tax=bacterium (Candidatus Ratteibacteria) CG23_combo_of_CG06-09_8_20_14_all_48_7 TaxID=2014292 RepID=A0A2G9YBS0_9BACT|nr:MAG: hypothetical protein COX46_01115 [bacterium (Candidatus Ratteibacteria) CG23_combo_of_CG06-09_8_20_14_all_48_7]
MKSADFQIKFDTRAARDLRKLRQKSAVIIPSLIRTINSLPTDPYQGKPLKGNKRGCYSCRVGDYRIIYEIYPTEKIIHIIRIGNRKEVYR